MSAAVEARWAVWGKSHGSWDEHRVLAHSEDEGGDAALAAAIRRLPIGDTWTSAGGIRLLFASEDTGEPRFGLAAAEAGDTDGFGRGTALVRYLDVPLATWITADQPFSALYAAYSTGVPEIPGRRAPIALYRPARPVSRTRKDHPDIYAWCVALTGAVVDGPTVITEAGMPQDYRLAVLDTVAALVPAWAKGLLSAATWSVTTQHDLRLSFGDAAAPDAIRAPWLGPIDDRHVIDHGVQRPSSGTAYAELLRSLCDEYSVDEIVARLAALTTAPDGAHDFAAALAELRCIEAIGAAVRDVGRSGEAVERYRLGRWPSDQRSAVQNALVAVSGDRPDLVGRWWRGLFAIDGTEAVRWGRELGRRAGARARSDGSVRQAYALWRAGADVDPTVAEAYATELVAVLAEPDRQADAVAWLRTAADDGRLAELRTVLAGRDDLLRDLLVDELRVAAPLRLADIRNQLAGTDLAWVRSWTVPEPPQGLGPEAAALLWALVRRTGPAWLLGDGARELVTAAVDLAAEPPAASRWRLLRQELGRPLDPDVDPFTRGRTDAARILLGLALRDLPAEREELAAYLDAYEQARGRVTAPAARIALLTAVVTALLERYPDKLPEPAAELLTGYAAGPGDDVRRLAELVIESFPKHRGLLRGRRRRTEFWNRLHAAYQTDPQRRLLIELGQEADAAVSETPSDAHRLDRLAELCVGARRAGWPPEHVLETLKDVARLNPTAIDSFLARYATRYGDGDADSPTARDELATVHRLIGGVVWGAPGERYRRHRLATLLDQHARHSTELSRLKNQVKAVVAQIAEYEAALTADEAELTALDDGWRR